MTIRTVSAIFRIAAALTLSAFVSLSHAATSPPQLLSAIPGSIAQTNTGGAPSQGVAVTFNAQQMFALKYQDEVEVTLPNGQKYSLVFELAQDHGNGIRSWIGYVKGLGNHARVIITNGPGGSFGSISTPAGEFRLVPGPGNDWLIDAKAEEALLPPPGPVENDALIPPPAPKRAVDKFNAPDIFVPVAGYNSVAFAKSTPTPNYVIDLYIVYTTGFAQALGTNVMTRLNFLVTRANTTYTDSEVAMTLRLVGASMVNYSDATSDSTALYAVTPGCTSGCAEAFDSATFGSIESLRAAAGADLVALLRNGSGFGGSGIAWVGSTSPNPLYSYSVVTGCTQGCESVFIHELGHNMGNKHDRYTNAWQSGGTAGGAYPNAFGYAFCKSGTLNCTPDIVNGLPGGCGGTQPNCAVPGDLSNFRDIMAYFQSSAQQIYKFSNPSITCATPGGDLVARPCGIALPAADATDTANSMNLNRLAVSSIKTQVIPSASLPGSLQFTATSYSTTEAAGTVTVTVSRVGGSFGAVSVQYATSNGSAVSGLDYVPSSGNLNWANGDAANKTFNITVTNDGVNENTEVFNVSLSNPSGTTGVYLGYPNTVSVAIAGNVLFPPANALPAGWLTPNGSSGAWTSATDFVYDATTSLRSAAVLAVTQGTFVNSDLVVPAQQYQSGQITFAYKVSAHPTWGFVKVLIDGVEVFSDTDTTSVGGAVPGWSTAAVPVTAGSHTITFRFANQLNFACNLFGNPVCADRAWIDALSLPVALANATNVLASGINPSVTGQSVTFTATVNGGSGTPTGIAIFRDGATPITGCTAQALSGAGVATCSTNALTLGTHSITAQYSGDVSYTQITSNTISQTVNAGGVARKPADLDGDGKSDIVIRDSATGVNYGWIMNGLSITNGGYLLSAGSGWSIAAFADLNGDGKADILIQHTDGSLYAWIMNGLTVTTGGYVLGAGTGFSLSHVGDFNGDGKADLIFKHTNGSTYVQLMNGVTALNGTFLQGAGSGWSVSHVADFDGDGKSDILLKHTDGSIYVDLMNGITVANGTFLIGAGSGWSATATGDFNGDGKADILITHTNGGVYLWQMNGIAITTGTFLQSPATGWSIAMTGDLDGDGKTDIVIKHTDGSHYAWIMNGLSVSTGGYLLGAGTGWSVSHMLDLNGDGKSDILIKHTDGSIYGWLMNGATIANGTYLMGAGPWRTTP
jgi:hypothetical protein